MNKRTKKSNTNKRFSFIKIILIILILVVAGGLAGMGAAIITNLDRLDALEYRPSFTTFIYDCNGKVIAKLYSENRIPVPISKMPQNLLDAVISIEDNRFYEHYGIDLRAIARALWRDIRQGDIVEGGSTITQQFAKCAFLTLDRNWWRKIQDALLAIQLERKYTKREILELYLNEIYLGPNANGVEAASQYYFGKHVWDLDLSECALLAAVIQSPGLNSPFYRPEKAKSRRDLVLSSMVRYGYITNEEANEAKAKPLGVVKPKTTTANAPYFIDHIKNILTEKYGSALLYRGGLKIYTTLDLEIQEIAERELFASLPTGNPNNHGVIQPQGALIAIEPSTGYVKAMVGGRGGDDYFNRATKALRQPGSAIKPLYYAAAIENKIFTPASIIDDSPIEYPSPSPGEKPWSPVNSDGQFRGPVSFRESLVNSLNVPSVKILDTLGLETALQTMKKLGITSLIEKGAANDRNLSSLGLGGLTRGISPLELAAAYSVFANQGIKVEPIFILKVVDNNGAILEESRPQKTIVFSEDTACIITNILQDVIKEGTGRRANINMNAAGKTGTSNNYTNAWFVGYTPELLATVWLGNDNQNQSMIFEAKKIGSGDAAEIWGKFMSEVFKDKPTGDFSWSSSNNVITVNVCKSTGLIPNEHCPQVKAELFIKGSEPTEECELHKKIVEVKICSISGDLAGEGCPEDTIEVKRFQQSSGLEVDKEGLPKTNGSTRPTEKCTLHQPKAKNYFPFSLPPWW